jgi:hypothetical protein
MHALDRADHEQIKTVRAEIGAGQGETPHVESTVPDR